MGGNRTGRWAWVAVLAVCGAHASREVAPPGRDSLSAPDARAEARQLPPGAPRHAAVAGPEAEEGLAPVPVESGKLYCARGWIRWRGGGWPTVTLERLGVGGRRALHTLFGRPGYPDGQGGTVTAVRPEEKGWRWYRKEVVMPAGVTAARLASALLPTEGKAGAPQVMFDGWALAEGPCPSAPTR